MKGFTKEETILIRKGIAKDLKLNTIILLAKSIALNKGKADGTSVDNFFSAGYDEAALIKLIGLITLRIFTNYVYAATEIQIDFPVADSIN
jgi:alkylhydroperoxidase family enzyme